MRSMFNSSVRVVVDAWDHADGNLARRRPYLFSSDRLRRLVAEWMPATRAFAIRQAKLRFGSHFGSAGSKGLSPCAKAKRR